MSSSARHTYRREVGAAAAEGTAAASAAAASSRRRQQTKQTTKAEKKGRASGCGHTFESDYPTTLLVISTRFQVPKKPKNRIKNVGFLVDFCFKLSKFLRF